MTVIIRSAQNLYFIITILQKHDFFLLMPCILIFKYNYHTFRALDYSLFIILISTTKLHK